MNPRCTCGEARYLTGGEHFRSCPWLYLEMMPPSARDAIEAAATAPWREALEGLYDLYAEEPEWPEMRRARALLKPAQEGEQ